MQKTQFHSSDSWKLYKIAFGTSITHERAAMWVLSHYAEEPIRSRQNGRVCAESRMSWFSALVRIKEQSQNTSLTARGGKIALKIPERWGDYQELRNNLASRATSQHEFSEIYRQVDCKIAFSADVDDEKNLIDVSSEGVDLSFNHITGSFWSWKQKAYLADILFQPKSLAFIEMWFESTSTST